MSHVNQYSYLTQLIITQIFSLITQIFHRAGAPECIINFISFCYLFVIVLPIKIGGSLHWIWPCSASAAADAEIFRWRSSALKTESNAFKFGMGIIYDKP